MEMINGSRTPSVDQPVLVSIRAKCRINDECALNFKVATMKTDQII